MHTQHDEDDVGREFVLGVNSLRSKNFSSPEKMIKMYFSYHHENEKQEFHASKHRALIVIVMARSSC